MMNEQAKNEQEIPVCASCGQPGTKRGTNDMHVELEDGTQQHVNLCDTCDADFWEDCGPGVFTRLDFLDREVCQPDWHCEDCDSVYDHNFMQIVIDTDYDPEREAVICGFCRRKYKDRYRPKQLAS